MDSDLEEVDSDLEEAISEILEPIILKAVKILYNCIAEIVSTINSFGSRLKQLLNTINNVNSFLNDTEKIEVCPSKDTVRRLKNDVEEAKQFCEECSKVSWWNCYKKYKYSKKLATLNDSLSELLDKVELRHTNQQQRTNAKNEKSDVLKQRLESGVSRITTAIFRKAIKHFIERITELLEY